MRRRERREPWALALGRSPAGWVVALAATLLTTAIMGGILRFSRIPNISLLYLFPVVAVAGAWGRRPAIGAAFLAFLCFDWFFVQPVHTFTVDDPAEWLALIVLLLAAVFTANLTAALRQRAQEAQQQAWEAGTLRTLASTLAAAHDVPEVLGQLRREAGTPVIVLSARHQEREKVAALDAGADDYLTKSFGIDELLARLRVALRRLRGPVAGQTATVHLGSLLIDLDGRLVMRGAEAVHLTPTEYELLKVLLGQRGRVVTRSRLITAVWGAAYADSIHTLHVHIATLRRKIEDNPANPVLLRTEPGVGYRLAAEDLPS